MVAFLSGRTAAAFWMRYSAMGRAIYAVGGNAEAARLAGISRERTIMAVFVIERMILGPTKVKDPLQEEHAAIAATAER